MSKNQFEKYTMSKKIQFLTFLLSFSFCLTAQNNLKSPNNFLPHKLGEQFTPHYLLVDYFQHLDANSNQMKLIEYGRTNQQRPLLLAFISTPENLNNLETIRKNNLRRANLLEGEVDNNNPISIVWMSYSVHGNEAAAAESSMAAAYELVNSNNAETQKWLQNTIVIIDPTINPDGSSRYSHWIRNISTTQPDPSHVSREHAEPWPGGRVNHYLFDLNRDWAWASQIETRQRLVHYNQWMPHIHADFHEQYPNNPYYFAPAARPYHGYITDWQGDFQHEIGANHAKHFDSNGWLYFTKEVFDLLYPSYGDTYPIFNGAIGMTYEQAGHSIAGRAYTMENGDTLTLWDRIIHHKTSALSTVEIASINASRITQQFEKYFQQIESEPPGEYKSFIIKGSNPINKLKALTTLLDRHEIKYGTLGKSIDVVGHNYVNGKEGKVEIGANDLVISAYQPKGLLTQVLFEPRTEVEDSLTYDITAWALPFAHGLEGYASKQKLNVKETFNFEVYKNNLKAADQPYGYVATWNSIHNARFLGAILQKDIKVRYSESGFELDGEQYTPGTLIMTRADNRKASNFDATVRAIAMEYEQEIVAAKTGLVASGHDFGSSNMVFIQKPKIAVLSGENTSTNAFGQVWYYFEQDLGYPITLVDAGNFSRMNLNDFNLIVLPEGRYSLSESMLTKLNSWISGGGRLIAIGSANRSLQDKSGFNLTKYAKKSDKSKAEKATEKARLENRTSLYKDRERSSIAYQIPGAIFKLKMDNSHPLGFGMKDYYFSLKTSGMSYDLMKNTWNVGYIEDKPLVSGFIGAKLKSSLNNTVVFAVQDKGRGSVTYMIDNPLYRAFWEEGKFLFSNAVFFVGQ